MIGAVPGAAVRVAPSIIARQEPVESREDVGLGARAELHDDHPRRGVRDEHREQAVDRVDVRQEPRAVVRQVDQRRLRARCRA